MYELEGGPRTSRDAVYDFGPVYMGQSVTKKIVIRNLGAGELTLSTLEKTEGVDVEISGTATGENPLFSIPFESGATLRSFEALELDVVYSAPELPETQVDHEVKLVLRAEQHP